MKQAGLNFHDSGSTKMIDKECHVAAWMEKKPARAGIAV